MASDIPDSYATAHAMANGLATYLNCPHEIIRRVKTVFDRAPDVERVRRMRAKFLKRDYDTGIRANDAYYPRDAARSLDETNRQFLDRLQAERAISQARENLKSMYLVRPDLVNAAWERAARAE